MALPLIYGRNVAQDVYVRALSSAYKVGWRLYDPDYALARDPDIYEVVRRDPIVAHAIDQRLHSIAGTEWRLEPNRPNNEPDKTVASIMEGLLNETSRFVESRYELASAVIRARAYCYMECKRKVASYEGGPLLRWLTPMRLRDVDRRRIRVVPNWIDLPGGRRRLHTNLELFLLEADDWVTIRRPEWFVRHVYNEEEARLGYGRGLLEAIYFYHWAKSVALREGLQGLERWAQGLSVARIDGARVASTGQPNTAVAEAWIEVLRKTKARHSMVMDKNDELEVYYPKGEGHSLVSKFLTYLDEGIVKLITGALRPTGGGEGGGYNRADTEQDEQEALVKYDRALLDEVLTRDLVGLLWRGNWNNFVTMGLASAKMPRFKSEHERSQDPGVIADVVSKLLTAQIPLRMDEVYKKVGFTPPKPGDEVFEGSPPSPAPGNAPPGAPGNGSPVPPGGGEDASLQAPVTPSPSSTDRNEYVTLEDLEKYGSHFFDKSQPRDPDGRWTKGSGGVGPLPQGGEDPTSPGEIATKALGLLEDKGGYTLDPETAESETSGFALSVFPEHEKKFDAIDSLSESDIEDYIESVRPTFEADDRVRLGGWYDAENDVVYLDASIVVQDVEEAEALARTHKQEAYFDLNTGESVYVRAREDSPEEGPNGLSARGDPSPDTRAHQEGPGGGPRPAGGVLAGAGGGVTARPFLAGLFPAVWSGAKLRDFDEDDHPRGPDGRWIDKDGGSTSVMEPEDEGPRSKAIPEDYDPSPGPFKDRVKKYHRNELNKPTFQEEALKETLDRLFEKYNFRELSALKFDSSGFGQAVMFPIGDGGIIHLSTYPHSYGLIPELHQHKAKLCQREIDELEARKSGDMSLIDDPEDEVKWLGEQQEIWIKRRDGWNRIFAGWESGEYDHGGIHSMYGVAPDQVSQFKIAALHEMGHILHHQHEDHIDASLSDVRWGPRAKEINKRFTDGSAFRSNPPTERAGDNWHEYIAESFALIESGYEEDVHPEVRRVLKELER